MQWWNLKGQGVTCVEEALKDGNVWDGEETEGERTRIRRRETDHRGIRLDTPTWGEEQLEARNVGQKGRDPDARGHRQKVFRRSPPLTADLGIVRQWGRVVVHERWAGAVGSWMVRSPDDSVYVRAKGALGSSTNVEVADGGEISKKSAITGLELSPDGSFLAVAQGNIFKIWYIDRGDVLHTCCGRALSDKIVSQSWSEDGLNTVFASGWVVSTKLGAKTTEDRFHRICETPIDLAFFDSNGGNHVDIFDRPLGRERWIFRERLSVPVDILNSNPIALSMFFGDFPASVTVIYLAHGIITWRIGRKTETPSVISRLDTEAIKACVKFDGLKFATVFKDINSFRVYDRPTGVLVFSFDTQDSPGPLTFADGGNVLIGAVEDTVYLWDLNPASQKKRPVTLFNEGTAGNAITSITVSPIFAQFLVLETALKQRSTPWQWTTPSHSLIAVAQGSTVTVWRAIKEPDINSLLYLRTGLLLGILLEILIIFLA
ncbi:hypothetical protein B0H12DRAFT_1074090 [Mycena haematopus]|nr:hypothetical protein B0H12DRAFT_1074090 [Mycena haematopus]